MKLTNVKTYVVQTPPPHSGGSFWFFVRLETDTGLVGWGETAILGALHGLEDAYELLVQQVFEGYLDDKNPINREALYHKMYEGMMAQHPDYVGMGVVSAIDIALWDIKGKAANMPIYQLLGGAQPSVFTYATGGYYVEGAPLSTCAEELATFVDKGYRAVKMKTGALPLADEITRIQTTREAIGDALLMLDMNAPYTVADCIRFARAVEPFDIY